MDAAVGSVVSALEARGAVSEASAVTGATQAVDAGPAFVAAVTARSVPDLASRLRSALARDGITIGEIGIAAAGLHHVATLELPVSARASLERAVAALGGQLSVVSGGAA